MTVRIEINVKEAFLRIDDLNEEALDAIEDSIDDMLTFIDNAQAKRYTQDSEPEKPAGSHYRRTFYLQNTTEKVHVLKYEGEWISDIPYSNKVLGLSREQADIHRGRWKSQEIVEQMAIDEAPSIIIKKVEGRLK